MRLVLVLVLSMAASVAASTSVASAAEKKNIVIKADKGEFQAVSGKELPEFVRMAIAMVPKDLGVSDENVIVVPDLAAFIAAYGVERSKLAPLMVPGIGTKRIFILMDRKLEKDDPLNWVVQLEAKWLNYRVTKQADPGMVALLAVTLTDEANHMSGGDQIASDKTMLQTLDTFVAQGKLHPQLADEFSRRIKADLTARR